jgi:molybdopterin molybdotransferase
MIGVDEAIARVATLARPLDGERVPLEEADGRILASAIVAPRCTPAYPVSAMDGYAVRDADIRDGPVRLRIAGRWFAGDGQPREPLAKGACARVFTGAPVPVGADRVVMQEEVGEADGAAFFVGAASGSRHIRAAGSDFVRGDTLLAAGARLTAQAMVLAAAADLAELDVVRRPRLAILATGSELAAPGTARLRPGAIPESVSFGVAALARAWGADVTFRRRLGDDLPSLTATAGEALAAADVVVVTGGASVGDKDYARAMFEPHGLEPVFCKVAMKPGKPVWIGRVGAKIVVGLPGNPSAALVTSRLFLAPILAGLGGRDPAEAWRWTELPMAGPLAGCGERENFLRARLTARGAMLVASQDSSGQKALATADLLLRRRGGQGVAAAGDPVEALVF